MGTRKEDILHDDNMFSLKTFIYQDTNCIAGLFSHWHEEFEILYLETGETNYRVNGKPYAMHSGDIMFVPSNAIHEATSDRQEKVTSYCIVFHPTLIQSAGYDRCEHEFILPLITGTLPFLQHIPKGTTLHDEILPHILKIIDLDTRKPYGYELTAKSLLLLIISTCITYSSQTQHTSHTTPTTSLMKEAIDYITTNYNKKFEIKQLSTRLNISDEHFCRLFKSYTNKRPVEYLNDYRIEVAAKQLLATNDCILCVALDCGFDNASYFTKKFKEKKGVTPKVFRIQNMT